MKRIAVRWLVGLWCWPVLAIGQIQVSFPVSRAVFQRTANNEATIHINGFYTLSLNRVEARVQARNRQGVSSDWVTIHDNLSDGNFAGDLTVRGGWYDLEIRGVKDGQPIAATVVERVGVGEVFIIAGQSNAQGVYDDMPSANDDRVNGLNYYDAAESAGDPPADVLKRLAHLDRGNSMAPRGIGTWCWGRLGDLLAERLNVPILFFNAGYGGTAIRNWRQSIETGHAENIYLSGTYHKDGQPYGNLRVALQFYTHMLGVRAVLWHQGEAENFVNTSFSSYVADLQFVISQSRHDSGKNIAWMVARVSYSGDIRGSRPEIIAAQNQVITSVPGVFAGPETDGIQRPRQRPPRTLETYDDVHFDVDGLREVANAWNSSLTDAFFAQAQPQTPVSAPQVSIGCATANQVTITVKGAFSSVGWNTGESGPTITKGTGTYRATIKDAVGNVLLSPVVRVADVPTIQAIGPTTFCEEGSVRLKASYPNNIVWTTKATSQELTVRTAGDYAVQYQDVSGCQFTSSVLQVRVNPLPAAPRITVLGSTTFCQGERTTLLTDEQVAYTWSSGQRSRRIDVQTTGSYTVTVTDQNGCTSPPSSALRVTVNPLPPTPTITTNRSTTFCADQRVTLTSTEDQQYQWTTGQTARAITIGQSGQYSLRTQNQFNCVSAPSTPVSVLVNPLPPAPTISASGRTTFCAGDQVVLTASSSLKPIWITGDSTPTIRVQQSGVYTAKVEDSNGCLSPASVALPVDVKPVPSVPVLMQTGTYTLEATGLLPGDTYRWFLNADTLLTRTAAIKASRSGIYRAQSFIQYGPTLTCSSAPSAGLAFSVDETNQQLGVYPNPSPTKRVSVETLADLVNAEIYIYTLSGQQVAAFTVPVFYERQHIDLAKLPDGMYVMQVRAADFLVAKRFLIGVGE